MEHDQDRVTKLVSEVREAVRVLQEMGKLSSEQFLENPDKVGNAKYQLIVAIEGCLDLSNHLISRNDLRMPEDYADTFQVLAENDVIEDSFADVLGEMARFRNRLVHLYWNVDDARIHSYLQTEIGDIERFLEAYLTVLG